jgi:uncharacterized delta-60 repeat protein
MRTARTAIVSSLLACSLAAVAGAFDGQLDPTFGTSGKVTTSFGDVFQDAFDALIVQPDGRLVAAGVGDGGDAFVVARYEPDGTLDASFGSGGVVALSVPGSYIGVATVAVQPDGKLLAAGSVSGFGSNFEDAVLMRFESDGALDTGFGTGGVVTANLDRSTTRDPC